MNWDKSIPAWFDYEVTPVIIEFIEAPVSYESVWIECAANGRVLVDIDGKIKEKLDQIRATTSIGRNYREFSNGIFLRGKD